MDKPTARQNNLIMMIIGTVALAALLLGVVLGERWWSSQGQLTAQFEGCMEQAPFKQSFSQTRPEDVLSPDNLQQHFNEFEQIFKATGLPPIWNGKKLVPWKIYHQESIIIAKNCHAKLGITQPQKQLRGTYGKPVWDPNSPIWLEDN